MFKKIYIDLDGVLADFFLEWKKIIGKEQDLSLVKEHILISFAKVFNIKGYI